MIRFILIGPRSVGKTTIGRALAKKLHVIFYDLDAIVDKKLNGLDRFIRKYGVFSYRKKEHLILKKFIEPLKGSYVLSVGGGTIASQYKNFNRQNQSLLSKKGLFVYLRPSLSEKKSVEILKKNELKRKGDQSAEEILKLWRLRTPVYEKVCDKKIVLGDKTNSEIVTEILSLDNAQRF